MKKSKLIKKDMKGVNYYVVIFPSDGSTVDDICYLGENNTMVKSRNKAIAFENLQDIIHNVNMEMLKSSEAISDVTIVKEKYKIEYL